jgi:hypothetical protein
MCVLYEGCGSIGFVTLMQPFPMVWSLQDDVISWCEPLGIRPDRATNVTYGMLCNGWGTDIVL